MEKAEKQVTYPVMEHFYTLQGEGAWSGHAAYFIRLGGCDVGCVWCDVKDSWDASAHPASEAGYLAKTAASSGTEICVVTGGEPAMYDLFPLTGSLHQAGLRTHIETSGAYPLTGDFDWVCVSPKKFKPPIEEVLCKADEFKVVVFHPSDIEWAQQFIRHLKPGCRLYLQPEWGRAEKVIPLLIEFIKSNPDWILSLQTHKYLQIP